jgi:hypothetical protein
LEHATVATTLPTPIEFRLPEGWRPAPPDEVDAPGVAFVALHPHPDAGFTANITIDGELDTADAPLTELADASITTLRDSGADVTLADRSGVGAGDAPGLTQTLTLRAMVNGEPRELVQSQVYLSMVDAPEPGHRAVVRLVLTATAAQFRAVLPDFQWFVWTVRPDTGAGGAGGAGGTQGAGGVGGATGAEGAGGAGDTEGAGGTGEAH